MSWYRLSQNNLRDDRSNTAGQVARSDHRYQFQSVEIRSWFISLCNKGVLNSKRGSWLGRLRDKGIRYWTATLVVLVLTTAGSPYVYRYFKLENARSYLFQRLLQFGPHPAEPAWMRIVLIEDDEYYLGDLAGRRPIKRTYLAEMVTLLASMNAHVIALDFDVRLPNPGSSEVPADYRAETAVLVDAIKTAAMKGKTIVLGIPISGAGGGQYRHDADIYEASKLCTIGDGPDTDSRSDPIKSRIICGYIALPRDPLSIPPVLPLVGGGHLISFSLAIAKAENPLIVERVLKRVEGGARYLDFISHDKFSGSNSIFSSRALREGKISQSQIDSKAVIVGAHWSRDAAGRGPVVDQQETPAGTMVGAELHANFAEAFLDSRIFSAASEHVLEVSEVLFSIFVAIVFALSHGLRERMVTILAVLVLAFFTTAIALREFGVFFDVFVHLSG